MEPASSNPKLREAFAHCAALVEEADPERATAILFAAPQKRSFLHALYAFDLETAGVRDRVTQPIPGEMRLQWWRERIETAAAGSDEASPVATALAETIRRFDLPVPAFDRLLEARVFDLYDDPMPSREAFETYAGETVSTVITLGAMILDRASAPTVAGLAGHAGVAALCRSVLVREAAHAARQQIYVPADILASVGLDGSRWLEGGEAAEPARVAVRALGREHLAKVEAGWRSIPRAVRPGLSSGQVAGPLSPNRSRNRTVRPARTKLALLALDANGRGDALNAWEAGRIWLSAAPRSLALAARLATGRFPVATTLIVAFALAANLQAGEVDLWGLDRWPRLLSALGGAAAFSVAVRVGAEALRVRAAFLALLPLAGAAAVGFTIWFGEPLALFAPALVAASVMAVPLAPFLRRGTPAQFWCFTLWSCVGAGLAFLSVLLFCLGLHAILEMVRFLFRVGVDWQTYTHIWTTALTLVGPLFALARIPPVDGPDLIFRADDALVRAVRSLLEWVATPLALATAVVLHVYGVRIVLTGEVPLDEVGWIVTFFLLLVLALRIGLDPFLPTGAAPTRVFGRLWAGALCFPLVILAYAAMLRIDAQGVTVSRYFLVVGALSGILVVVSQLLPRLRGDIRLIAAIPVVLLALSVAGPWSAGNVVGRSQIGFIAATALDENDRLDLERMDRASLLSLRSRVGELAETDQLWRLEPFIPVGMDEARRMAKAPHGRANRRAILNALGLQSLPGTDTPEPLRSLTATATAPLDLAGYDTAFTAMNVERTEHRFGGLGVRFEGRDLAIGYSGTLDRVDLGPALDALPAELFEPSDASAAPPVFDLRTQAGRSLRVRLESVSVDLDGQPHFATLTLLWRQADWPAGSGGG